MRGNASSSKSVAKRSDATLIYYVKEALPSSAYVNIKVYDTSTYYAYEKDITDKRASRSFDKYTTPSCGESVYV